MDSKESLKFNNQLIHRDLIASDKNDLASKDVKEVKDPITGKVVKETATNPLQNQDQMNNQQNIIQNKKEMPLNKL